MARDKGRAMDPRAPCGHPVSHQRLRTLARQVASGRPTPAELQPCALVVPQLLAIAEPWIVAGLGTALWAYAPQLMRLFRKLNPRDTLAGTTLTKEQLEAWSEGLHTMPVGHVPGSVTREHRHPANEADVLHPKRAPLVGVPAAALPLAMVKRLSFAKVLSERLGEHSEALALAHDLVEQIGQESVYAQTEVLEAVHDNWVSDAAGTLDRNEFGALNGMCNQLYAAHGVELAVVTVSGKLKQSHAREFSTKLFNHWGVGNAEANTGVLVVLSGLSLGPGQKSVDIVVGDGFRDCGVLPDSVCQHVIQYHMLRDLRRGAFGKALVHGVKKIAEYVEHHTHTLPRSSKDAPAEPSEAFGGGRRTSSLFTDKPLGPLPPLLLGAGAFFGSKHLAKYRCSNCGKLQVVTNTSYVPVETGWVDDVELALAELMDEDGRVPRREAAAAIMRHVPLLPGRNREPMIGRGMLAQLFMLEVPEPDQEFASTEGNENARSKKVQSEEMMTYTEELSHAQSHSGSADFTRLVMLLRQSITTGCFTDEVAQTTYTCSACGHARNPHYARHAVAGHDWDGGHAVAVPRDRQGNDGERVRVYLICKRSGIRRFLRFTERTDYRNRGAIVDNIAVWYSMQMISDFAIENHRREQFGVGRWSGRDGTMPTLWSSNGIYSFSVSTSSGGSRVGGISSGGGGSFGGGGGGGFSSGGGASASF